MRVGRWLLVTAIGCGYTSQYEPPDDSRVRPVWIGRSIVPVGPREVPACAGDWEGTPAPWVAEPTFFQRPPAPWLVGAPTTPVDDREDDESDDDAVVGAIGAVIAVTAIASASLALAIAPVGETRTNAITIDAINQFNDELRDPNRCGDATEGPR